MIRDGQPSPPGHPQQKGTTWLCTAPSTGWCSWCSWTMRTVNSSNNWDCMAPVQGIWTVSVQVTTTVMNRKTCLSPHQALAIPFCWPSGAVLVLVREQGAWMACSRAARVLLPLPGPSRSQGVLPMMVSDSPGLTAGSPLSLGRKHHAENSFVLFFLESS